MGEATRLGRYRLGERVGSGGLAEVYLAHAEGAKGFRKRVVVKRLRGERVGDPEAAASLLAEARLVAGLTHEGIVQVLDLGIDDDAPYVVLEHVDGVTLYDLMLDAESRGAPLDAGVVRRITCSIADALEHAHHAVDDDDRPLAIVHGDVTPSNVLISREGQVKLTDFGIARIRGEAGHGVGTPGYRAPEQERGATIDARADLYGLGAILAELASALPVDDRARAPLLALAAGATAATPDDRPASARALGEAIAALSIDEAGARDELASRVRSLQAARRSNASRLGAALEAREAGPRTAIAAPSVGSSRGRRVQIAIGVAVALALLVPAVTHFSGAADLEGSERPGSASPTSRADTTAASELVVHRSPIDDAPPIESPSIPRATESPPVVDPATTASSPSAATTASSPSAATISRPRRPPATPPPAPGRLRVNLIPFAEVRVDGREVGKTPIDLPLAPGPHTLVLENPQSGLRRARDVTIAAAGEIVITEW